MKQEKKNANRIKKGQLNSLNLLASRANKKKRETTHRKGITEKSETWYRTLHLYIHPIIRSTIAYQQP